MHERDALRCQLLGQLLQVRPDHVLFDVHQRVKSEGEVDR